MGLIMKSQSQHKHYCKYLSKRQKIYKKKQHKYTNAIQPSMKQSGGAENQ